MPPNSPLLSYFIIQVDDVGALCVLHALVDNGEAQLLAAVHNSDSPRGVDALAAINAYFGRPAVPVGAYSGGIGDPTNTSYASPWGFQRPPPARPWQVGPYVDDLVEQFPSRVRTASEADGSALAVLRRTLRAAAPSSVTIVSVGYLTNLHDLLRSGADDESPLTGIELVRASVARLVVMGGRHTFHIGDPVEWNLAGADHGISVCANRSCGAYNNLGAISNATLALWPTDVERVFIDFETGVKVWTGGVLALSAPDDSPCRRAYQVFCSVNLHWCQGTSRCSWDIQAAVYAVRGTEEWYARERGHNTIDPATGHNAWVVAANQSDTTLREFTLVLSDAHVSDVEQEISDLLVQSRPSTPPFAPTLPRAPPRAAPVEAPPPTPPPPTPPSPAPPPPTSMPSAMPPPTPLLASPGLTNTVALHHIFLAPTPPAPLPSPPPPPFVPPLQPPPPLPPPPFPPPFPPPQLPTAVSFGSGVALGVVGLIIWQRVAVRLCRVQSEAKRHASFWRVQAADSDSDIS